MLISVGNFSPVFLLVSQSTKLCCTAHPRRSPRSVGSFPSFCPIDSPWKPQHLNMFWTIVMHFLKFLTVKVWLCQKNTQTKELLGPCLGSFVNPGPAILHRCGRSAAAGAGRGWHGDCAPGADHLPLRGWWRVGTVPGDAVVLQPNGRGMWNVAGGVLERCR